MSQPTPTSATAKSACDDLTPEQFHDKHISPLVDQIIRLCLASGIPALINFSLKVNEDPNDDLQCTTLLPGADRRHPKAHLRAIEAGFPGLSKSVMDHMKTHPSPSGTYVVGEIGKTTYL